MTYCHGNWWDAQEGVYTVMCVNCKLYNIHILVYKSVYKIAIKSVYKYCMDISPTWVSSAAAQVESPHGRRVAWVEVGGPGKVELVH